MIFSGDSKRLVAWNGLKINKIQEPFEFHTYTNEKSAMTESRSTSSFIRNKFAQTPLHYLAMS